jgi:hypothetical protein
MTPIKNQSARGGTFLLGEDRRRSQRVVLRVSVTLKFQVAAQSVVVSGSTVSVNDHGAMLLCSRALESGALLTIQHDATRKEVPCRVTRVPCESSEGYLIPVEFLEPATDFWQISFPPTDWKAVQ